MKASDLKVVAIILAIALFFTIVTSNAVSIASVVMLAKGGVGGGTVAADGTGTGTGTDVGQQQGTTPSGGTSTTPSGGTSTTPSGGTSTTPTGSTSTTPSGGTSTTPSGGTSTTPSGGNDQPADQPSGGNDQPADQPSGGNDQPADQPAAGEWDTAKCFNFYKTACDNICNTGAAGHTRKEWQDLKALNLGAASSLLEGVLKGFMTSEADAGESVSDKGDDKAKDRMAPCRSTLDYVQSATKEDLPNGNYKITIVMKDENTPAKGSAGIASMSTGILYMEDVQDTVVNDSTVSKIVKSLDKGEIIYKAYTITAEMTKDGKFVSIDHVTTGELSATATVKLIGQISGSGVLEFHSKWYNFVY